MIELVRQLARAGTRARSLRELRRLRAEHARAYGTPRILWSWTDSRHRGRAWTSASVRARCCCVAIVHARLREVVLAAVARDVAIERRLVDGVVDHDLELADREARHERDRRRMKLRLRRSGRLNFRLQYCSSNDAELKRLIESAANHHNIRRVLVGNEAILRTDVTVEEQIANIQRVKRQVNVPVSTAEPWHVWLAHPELVAAVDYITVHILPYWEGVPAEGAVDYAMLRYNELRQKYPNKHILIGEIGWPSDGPGGAEPKPAGQPSEVLAEFFNVAGARATRLLRHGGLRPAMEDGRWKARRAPPGACGTPCGSPSPDDRRHPGSTGLAGPGVIAIAFAFLPTVWFASAAATLSRAASSSTPRSFRRRPPSWSGPAPRPRASAWR